LDDLSDLQKESLNYQQLKMMDHTHLFEKYNIPKVRSPQDRSNSKSFQFDLHSQQRFFKGEKNYLKTKEIFIDYEVRDHSDKERRHGMINMK
jgi:hypothetical protein